MWWRNMQTSFLNVIFTIQLCQTSSNLEQIVILYFPNDFSDYQESFACMQKVQKV